MHPVKKIPTRTDKYANAVVVFRCCKYYLYIIVVSVNIVLVLKLHLSKNSTSEYYQSIPTVVFSGNENRPRKIIEMTRFTTQSTFTRHTETTNVTFW